MDQFLKVGTDIGRFMKFKTCSDYQLDIVVDYQTPNKKKNYRSLKFKKKRSFGISSNLEVLNQFLD